MFFNRYSSIHCKEHQFAKIIHKVILNMYILNIFNENLKFIFLEK